MLLPKDPHCDAAYLSPNVVQSVRHWTTPCSDPPPALISEPTPMTPRPLIACRCSQGPLSVPVKLPHTLSLQARIPLLPRLARVLARLGCGDVHHTCRSYQTHTPTPDAGGLRINHGYVYSRRVPVAPLVLRGRGSLGPKLGFLPLLPPVPQSFPCYMPCLVPRTCSEPQLWLSWNILTASQPDLHPDGQNET